MGTEATLFSSPSERAAHSLGEGTRFLETHSVQGLSKAQVSEVLVTRT